MSDQIYIIHHPLLATIYRRCAALSQQASELPEGSTERKEMNRRISQLEQYRLPKPDARDLEQTSPIFDESGQKIGERYSLRRRFINNRRGRPEERTIQTRAALETKLEHPEITWRELAEKFGFPDGRALERAVRRLKALLRSERIALPRVRDYLPFKSK